MVAIAPGLSGRDTGLTSIHAPMRPCQVIAIEPPPACWAGRTSLWIVHISAALLCAGRPSMQPWPDACHCGDDVTNCLCQGISELLCPSPCPTHLGVLFRVIAAGVSRRGPWSGGHRGRRPHKSPASIARSKLRPGKRERQALQHGAVVKVDTTAASVATSSATASSAATPSRLRKLKQHPCRLLPHGWIRHRHRLRRTPPFRC